MLRSLLGVGEVDDLAGFWGDEEDIPLLIAVGVGGVGDPVAVGRPSGLNLTLLADSELRRPSAGGGNQPDVVAPADVGDEGDLFAVGR